MIWSKWRTMGLPNKRNNCLYRITYWFAMLSLNSTMAVPHQGQSVEILVQKSMRPIQNPMTGWVRLLTFKDGVMNFAQRWFAWHAVSDLLHSPLILAMVVPRHGLSVEMLPSKLMVSIQNPLAGWVIWLIVEYGIICFAQQWFAGHAVSDLL